LLNHIIGEELPVVSSDGKQILSNSDPFTGQAAWFDTRVRIYKADARSRRSPSRSSRR
jgi:hypothetical protein